MNGNFVEKRIHTKVAYIKMFKELIKKFTHFFEQKV